MPRDSLLRGLLYQAPYALVQALGAWVVLSRRRPDLLDNALVALFSLSALHYLLKPFLAALIGSGGSPQGYIHSEYAAYSQTAGAILLVSNGLLMLLVILRDTIADITARSETDTLSGLLNRRGFEARVAEALARQQATSLPAALITADLDRFKQINDAYGHGTGDEVIAAFSAVLKRGAGDRGDRRPHRGRGIRHLPRRHRPGAGPSRRRRHQGPRRPPFPPWISGSTGRSRPRSGSPSCARANPFRTRCGAPTWPSIEPRRRAGIASAYGTRTTTSRSRPPIRKRG
jgi:hypothetical protein